MPARPRPDARRGLGCGLTTSRSRSPSDQGRRRSYAGVMSDDRDRQPVPPRAQAAGGDPGRAGGRRARHERVVEGCSRSTRSHDREDVTVYGSLKNVSLAPRAGTPTLEATLYDGSGAVTLVWLGRRKIAGIKPGVGLGVRAGVVPGRPPGHLQPPLRAPGLSVADQAPPAHRSQAAAADSAQRRRTPRSRRWSAPSCPRRSAASAACSRAPSRRSGSPSPGSPSTT